MQQLVRHADGPSRATFLSSSQACTGSRVTALKSYVVQGDADVPPRPLGSDLFFLRNIGVHLGEKGIFEGFDEGGKFAF